jgi:hypothetical protein
MDESTSSEWHDSRVTSAPGEQAEELSARLDQAGSNAFCERESVPEERVLHAIFGEPYAQHIPETHAPQGAAIFTTRFHSSDRSTNNPENPLFLRWIISHVPTAEIEEITALASAVLEGRDKAVKWLSEPNLATDSRPPIDLIGEQQGFERVKNLLLRIEFGVLA